MIKKFKFSKFFHKSEQIKVTNRVKTICKTSSSKYGFGKEELDNDLHRAQHHDEDQQPEIGRPAGQEKVLHERSTHTARTPSPFGLIQTEA